MSRSIEWTTNPNNIAATIEAYCSMDKPTTSEVAWKLKTTDQNVRFVLRHSMDSKRYKEEKRLRYSRSKIGDKNPMLGKNGEQHPNHKGDLLYGDRWYRTRSKHIQMTEHRGSLVPRARIVMAEQIGIPVDDLPSELIVHHIDENTQNDSPDNLALLTPSAHRKLHTIMNAAKAALEGAESKKSDWWAKWVSGISKLP